MYTMIWSALCGSLLSGNYPFGTYYAKVHTPAFFPSQEIIIHTDHPSRASIVLRGMVNFDDHFSYEIRQDVFTWHFSPEMTKILQKWKCKLMGFDYNAVNNSASILLKIPILGVKNITMQNFDTRY